MRTLIIGAGFSGLGAAIRLQKEGHDFLMIEGASQVGGTWSANTYPGCACDIPAALYSLSFAPNYAWTRRYPQQPEIRAYLQKLVSDHGLAPKLRLSTTVQSLEWQEGIKQWQATLHNGEVLSAEHVICALGALVRPKAITAPGVERFAGPQLHSARWDASVQLAGKRVALVGTGASAIQLLPELAKVAATVTVFQRTPAWVLPRFDRAVRPASWLGAKLARQGWYWSNELRVGAFLGVQWMQSMVRALAGWHMRRAVKDKALQAALTPDYSPGCKRILVSDDYFASFARPNVELVSHAVQEITEQGLVSVDGRTHQADVIVYATGFDLEPLIASNFKVTGRAGASLNTLWSKNAATHLGLASHGFPNLYFLLGPNTALGHNSVVFMSECALNYVLGAIRYSTQQGRALELKSAVQAESYAAVQKALKTTVWASGCQSWYQRKAEDGQASGPIDTLWPGSTVRYWWKTRRFEKAAFDEI
jgi:cation diffusion facilitator CzcD-associated flavoprotein CzcO